MTEHSSHKFNFATVRTYSNVLVVPISDFFASAEHVYTGGPLWNDWEAADWAGYWYSNGLGEQRMDRRPDVSQPRKRFDDRPYFWIGPAIDHYGHQIRDFSSRILGSLTAEPNAMLVYAVKHRSRPLPQWFWSINAWFGVSPERVVLVSEPSMFPRLSVVPQPEWAGPNYSNLPPDPAYIASLTAHAEKQLGGPDARAGRYFISRSKLPGGPNILGESAIARSLQRLEFETIFPETLSLRDQLAIFKSAESLLFSSGSAIHGVQLLGKNVAHADILRRHTLGNWDSILASRCDSFTETDCISKTFAIGEIILWPQTRSTLSRRCLEVNFSKNYNNALEPFIISKARFYFAILRDGLRYFVYLMPRLLWRALFG